MKKLWIYIDKTDLNADAKYRLACAILASASALLGLLIWLVLRNWVLSDTQWMFCFIGYPAIISTLVVFFYGCNHEFHDGN